MEAHTGLAVPFFLNARRPPRRRTRTSTAGRGSGKYIGTKEHCIDVDWPASFTYSALQYRRGYNGPDSWMGSLIFNQRDASGLYYRRNRYYDSDKGRFTQEDPIGLAGGVNVYGFAGGDPVSYSDPYGLWCPKGYIPLRTGSAVPRELALDPIIGNCISGGVLIGGGISLIGAQLLGLATRGLSTLRQGGDRISGVARAVRILREARDILRSPQLGALRSAASRGVPAEVRIGERTVVYAPDMSNASGMTLFGESGFVIGPNGFSSPAETAKTVLHELFRLETSASGSGVNATIAAQETARAARFAETAYSLGSRLGLW